MKRVCLLLLACALSTGCAAPQPAAGRAGSSPYLNVVEEAQQGEAVAAETIYSSAQQSARFDVIDKRGRATSITISREPTTKFGASWREDDGGSRSEFLRTDSDGNVELVAAIDHDEKALSHFKPPLIVAYATLPPGESRDQEVRIRVVDSRNPDAQRESGTVHQRIHHHGRSVIETAGGRFEVDRVAIDFEADLRMADVRRSSMLYVSSEHGLIAAEHEEVITALGLFNTSTRQTMIRRNDTAQATDSAGASPDSGALPH